MSTMDRQVIVRLSFPRGSGISVTAVSRTPSTEEPPITGRGHQEPGGGAPIIEHNDNVEVDLTDGGGPASESPGGSREVDIEAEWNNILSDTNIEAMDIEVESEATAARGRPPQLQKPVSNRGQQRWARVRARLTFWRLACHPTCGHVCTYHQGK